MSRITAKDVTEAMAVMSQTIPFFPTGVLALRMIQQTIESNVATREQLEWLAQTACNTMEQFSIPKLLGIFYSRYGQDQSIGEAAYQEREAREYDRKLAAWQQEAKLLGEGPKPFQIPDGAYHPMAAPQRKPVVREQPGAETQRSLGELEGELQQQMEQSQKRSTAQSARLVEELEWQLRLAREMEKKLAQS